MLCKCKISLSSFIILYKTSVIIVNNNKQKRKVFQMSRIADITPFGNPFLWPYFN